jgi:hypothetical protein
MGVRNEVGTECGIGSPVAHETSILEVGINFCFSTRALFLFLSVSLEILIQEESIPARNQFLLRSQYLGKDYQ